jgi:aryl-alcohol dehydrogenase-like predicted oxidoreductase
MSQAPKYNTYRILGRSGLRVSPLCLGAMQLGTAWQNTFKLATTPEESEKIILRYLELGGNFIDTASNYQDGESETIIGDVLEKHKDRFPRESYVIATKFSLPNNVFNHTQGPNASGNLKKNLVRSIDLSLKRLKTDYVDILYVHYWDWTMRPEEIMKFLEDVVIRTGKALHIAVSDTPAWIVSRCNSIAENQGWSPFIAYQGRYSLIDRAMEQEVIPCCQALGLGVVPWGVLGQGKLTGRNLRNNENAENASSRVHQMSESEYAVQDVVIEIAKELGVTASQVSNNYAVHINNQTSVLIAPRNVEQLEDLFASLDFKLSQEQRQKLEQVSQNSPAQIFPTSFVGNGKEPCEWVYGIPKSYGGTSRPFNIEL